MIAAGGHFKEYANDIRGRAPHAMNSPGAVISVSTTYEINIGGVPYHSAAEIARKYGYVRDYVARLCRQGKVRGRRLGKLWYVDTEFAAPSSTAMYAPLGTGADMNCIGDAS